MGLFLVESGINLTTSSYVATSCPTDWKIKKNEGCYTMYYQYLTLVNIQLHV